MSATIQGTAKTALWFPFPEYPTALGNSAALLVGWSAIYVTLSTRCSRSIVIIITSLATTVVLGWCFCLDTWYFVVVSFGFLEKASTASEIRDYGVSTTT
jgi:hypothetical protein